MANCHGIVGASSQIPLRKNSHIWRLTQEKSSSCPINLGSRTVRGLGASMEILTPMGVRFSTVAASLRAEKLARGMPMPPILAQKMTSQTKEFHHATIRHSTHSRRGRPVRHLCMADEVRLRSDQTWRVSISDQNPQGNRLRRATHPCRLATAQPRPSSNANRLRRTACLVTVAVRQSDNHHAHTSAFALIVASARVIRPGDLLADLPPRLCSISTVGSHSTTFATRRRAGCG
jgi:hypothetical protein